MTTKNKYKLLVVDCDGTLTPNKTFYTIGGRFLKVFDSRDSYAIKRFMKSDYRIIILTSDKSGFPITQRRAEDWGVEAVYSSNKLKFVEKIINATHPLETIFVGNGPEDVVVIDVVDRFYAPKDSTVEVLSHREVGKKIAVLETLAGNGVLDEVYRLLNA